MTDEEKWYQQGVRAFHAGRFADENPYKCGVPRQNWFDGFYDTKHDVKFGKMFRAKRIPTMKQERQRSGYSFQKDHLHDPYH